MNVTRCNSNETSKPVIAFDKHKYKTTEFICIVIEFIQFRIMQFPVIEICRPHSHTHGRHPRHRCCNIHVRPPERERERKPAAMCSPFALITMPTCACVWRVREDANARPQKPVALEPGGESLAIREHCNFKFEINKMLSLGTLAHWGQSILLDAILQTHFACCRSSDLCPIDCALHRRHTDDIICNMLFPNICCRLCWFAGSETVYVCLNDWAAHENVTHVCVRDRRVIQDGIHPTLHM